MARYECTFTEPEKIRVFFAGAAVFEPSADALLAAAHQDTHTLIIRVDESARYAEYIADGAEAVEDDFDFAMWFLWGSW